MDLPRCESTGKVCRTRRGCIAALQSLRRAHPAARRYKCPDCRCYHLTRMTREQAAHALWIQACREASERVRANHEGGGR